jgi:hypothetical protein
MELNVELNAEEGIRETSSFCGEDGEKVIEFNKSNVNQSGHLL